MNRRIKFSPTVLILGLMGLTGCQTTAPIKSTIGSQEVNSPTTQQSTFHRPIFTEPPVKQRQSPDGLVNHFLQKRLPVGARELPADGYAKALQHLQSMPRYSAKLGRFLNTREKASAPAWEELGPHNVAGRARAMAFDPRNVDRILVGGVSGGIWETLDGGNSWRTQTDGMNNINVGAIVFDPVDPNTVYAGTGELYRLNDRSYASMGGAGVFRSRDGGKSFAQLLATANANFRYVSDVVVSAHDHNRVYVATNTGVWISRDAGASFAQQLKPSDANGGLKYEGCSDLLLLPDANKDVLLASCASRSTDDRYWLPNTVTPAACGINPCPSAIFRNSDAGGDGVWSSVLSESGMGRVSMDVAKSNPSIVYALAASILPGFDRTGDGLGDYDNGLHAVFRSNDGGMTWNAQVRNNSADAISTYLLSYADTFNPVRRQCNFSGNATPYSAGWYNQALAVDPVNPEVVWVAGMELYRSDDGGRSFGKSSYYWLQGSHPTGVHADQHTFRFHPNYDGNQNQILYVLNDGGMARTQNATASVRRDLNALCGPANDMVSWTELLNGMGTIQFYTGAVSATQSLWMGGAQDNSTLFNRSGFPTNNWVQVIGGDGGQVAIDPRNDRVIYGSWQNGNIMRSDSGGATFVVANNGINDDDIFIMPFVLDTNAPDRLYAGGTRIWRTDNKGGTWRAVSASFGSNFGNRISAMAIAPGNPNRILVGNQVGIYRNNNATSSVANTVWQGTSPRAGWVSSLTFAPNNQNTVYATYASFGGDHVWRSLDGGATWSAIDGAGTGRLPDIPVHSLAVDPNDSQRLFVGTDVGVFVSVNGGASWAVENTGFANTITEVVTIAPASTFANLPTSLYAFTYGRGAWRVPLASLDGVATYRIDAKSSGTFYNATQSGHGLVIQQIESGGVDQILVAWFTYLNGEQRWLIGQGEVQGDRVTVPLLISSGADFPPNFSAAAVNLQPWGTMTLRFDDANHLNANWSTSLPGFGSGEMTFERLTSTLLADANASGTALNACHSGAWFDPSQSGHGVFAEVFGTPAAPQLLAIWYAYQDGKQRWFLGTGPIQNNRAVLDTITTRGGEFPPNFVAANVVREPWGTMSFEAINANQARWQWQSTQSDFGAGELNMVRLSQLKGSACQ